MSFPRRIIIIGAGPAGLMAAVAASRSDAEVMVLEQMPRPGMKLLASGGGRCNLTNVLPENDFISHFGRQGRFMLPALNDFSRDELLNFMHEHGVETEITDGFHIFPKSGRANDVLRALLDECEKNGARVNCNVQVAGLSFADGRIDGVKFDGKVIAAERVIIASGGKGYPALGGLGRGYELARQAGHDIVPPIPAMVGLRTRENWPGECPGISLKNCELFIDLPKYRGRRERGELLFTHRGISGPPVIDISGDVSSLLEKHEAVPLNINLFAGRDREYWLKEFNTWQQAQGRKQIHNLLAAHMPQSLAVILCREAQIVPETRAAAFPARSRDNLAALLSSAQLHVGATEDWEKAMVTRGGVALKQVSPDSLESRIVTGLFFAGEVLDIDGPCGGFNLQWAFSSGHLAGTGAAMR